VSIVFHNDPFTPFDRHETPFNDSPGFVPGNRRSIAIPDGLFPTAVDAARLRVGARPLDVAQWVSPVDDDWAPTIAMKRALIAERPHEVIACVEGAEEACEEVAAECWRLLVRTHQWNRVLMHWWMLRCRLLMICAFCCPMKMVCHD
jgi:hypothetical protein